MLTEEQRGALVTDRWTGCYESGRGGLFTKESNRHPAKMAVGLCFRIFEHGEKMGYWKKGDPETRKRERKSFFKRLYEKKFPELAVDYEDVLFFRKP